MNAKYKSDKLQTFVIEFTLQGGDVSESFKTEDFTMDDAKAKSLCRKFYDECLDLEDTPFDEIFDDESLEYFTVGGLEMIKL